MGHPDDRAFLLGLVQQLVVAVLAAAGVVGGILLAVAPGGPQLAPGLGAYALVGALLAFAGFVLGCERWRWCTRVAQADCRTRP